MHKVHLIVRFFSPSDLLYQLVQAYLTFLIQYAFMSPLFVKLNLLLNQTPGAMLNKSHQIVPFHVIICQQILEDQDESLLIYSWC